MAAPWLAESECLGGKMKFALGAFQSGGASGRGALGGGPTHICDSIEKQQGCLEKGCKRPWELSS